MPKSKTARPKTAPPAPRRLEEIDKFLAAGGFRRATRPKGALARSRAVRDERKTPRPAKAMSVPLQKIEVLRAPAMKNVVHGFSTRTGGFSTVFGGHDLNLGLVKHDNPELIKKNRAAFFAEAGAAGRELVTLKQIHSSRIVVIEKDWKSLPSPIVADGAITDIPGVLLSIQTADCVPVLLYDSAHKAVGAFHAGWRGTAQRIVEKGVGVMRMRYGSQPATLRAAIGPCIGACCYAVGDEVVDAFHSQFDYAQALFREVYDDDPVKMKYPLLFLTARAPGHSDIGPQTHLDLVEANRRQLLAAGVKAKNIWSSGLCTGCERHRLFSHRKEDGFTGRMMAVIGV